ncbi:heterokaryon incompatibility protein-domain-containing protein [Phaeosphaeria sp. MPI-PUGE-AT-0046c]|nr:heterokaryon incompatibility protein-domain-containing protein [Phaeosphaeria sp. MPI-PUGE-AT-0046c]
MSWHANCIREHTICRSSSRSGYFPTRVLDIGLSRTSGRVQLINDPSLRKPYVALSHRWGKDVLPITIRNNLQARLQGFDMADLSPTMRSAIWITQNLHYDYIWIDALCIVQDSEEDWFSEASQMSNVFSNAAVTIAVADAVEHSQGIFRNRESTFIRPFNIPFLRERPYRERAHLDGDGEFYLFPDAQEVRSRGPLDTRGWILQEQLLSPSILYFDRGEIFWDCITVTASESSPISASLLSEADPDEVWALKYIRRMIAGSGNHDTRRDQISNAWLEIIKNYSNRDLTKASDRLIALQGIITPLQRILNEDHVAGMWRTQLWRQLTWWMGPTTAADQDDFPAPSWSWLSVTKRVHYHNSLLGEPPEHDAVAHRYTDLRSFSFIVDRVESRLLDGTSGVTGSMTVTGKSFPYRLTQMDLKKPVHRRWHAVRLKLNTGRWMLDRPVEVPLDIQCLIVAEDAATKSLVCLCIVPDAERAGMWRRVGLCHWDGLSWQISTFISATPETRTFTLV